MRETTRKVYALNLVPTDHAKDHRKWRRLRAIISYLLVGMGLSIAMPAIAQISTRYPEVKALKRTQLGFTRSNTLCTLQIRFNQEDFLASLTEKELAKALKEARSGDADAMFFLAQIPKEDDAGERSYPYREEWLPKAIAAGHPIARYQEARRLHEKFERLIREETSYFKGDYSPDIVYIFALLTQPHAQSEPEFVLPEAPKNAERWKDFAQKLIAEYPEVKDLLPIPRYLALIEEAALAEGSGSIAWELADAYRGWWERDTLEPFPPTGSKAIDIVKDRRSFSFLPNKRNDEKENQWVLVAAERNHPEAAADICLNFSHFGGRPKKHPEKALRWCSIAAQSPCTSASRISSAFILSRMYEDGFTVPKSKIDTLYWLRIDQLREKETSQQFKNLVSTQPKE